MIFLEALKLIIESAIIVLGKVLACESVFICAVIGLGILVSRAYNMTFGDAK